MSYMLSMHLWSKKNKNASSLKILEFTKESDALVFAKTIAVSPELESMGIDYRFETDKRRIFPHNEKDILREIEAKKIDQSKAEIEAQVSLVIKTATDLSN